MRTGCEYGKLSYLVAGMLLLGAVRSSAGPAYPLKAAPAGRYLVDQDNNPFLIVGAAPHNLFSTYSLGDAHQYLTNRATEGINTLWVELITGAYTGNDVFDGRNVAGDAPFLTMLGGGHFDLTTTNLAYWIHARNVVNMAATNGIQILLDSIETGQYMDTALANGTNRCRQYGRFIGTFFKDCTNIIWITGNDYQTWRDPDDDACILNIAAGIADNDTNHLQTVQLDFLVSMSYENENWRNLIGINGIYTYYMTYHECLVAWNTNPMPVLVLEANYEGEANVGGAGGSLSNLRRQEYWSLLAGSLAGHMYGDKYEWRPLSGWQSNLNTPGVTHLGYFRDFFTNRTWYALVPDQSHQLVAAGYGTYEGREGDAMFFPENGNYVTAACTPDGTFGVAYTPVSHTLTVVMTNFVSAVTTRWFDPTANTFTTVAGSPFPNTVTTNLTTPGNNAAGDPDWVLLLEAQPIVTQPRIIKAGFSGSDFVLLFDTVPGQSYNLESLTYLPSGSWEPIVTNIQGTGATVQVSDTNAVSNLQRFYRVRTGM